MCKRSVTFFCLVICILLLCCQSLASDASKDNPSQLVIQGMSSAKVNEIFQSSYPDTLLTCNYETISSDTLSTKLLTQDDSVDLYMVQIDAAYASIKAKGYFASLAGSALLQQACGDFSDTMLEAVTEKDVLVAYPASLSLSTFGVNLDYWQLVFGDDPLPETMEDLLDAWILYEESYGDEYPLLDMWYGFDEETLCREFITYYIQTHAEAASTLATDDALRNVLQKLRKVAELRRRTNAPYPSGMRRNPKEKLPYSLCLPPVTPCIGIHLFT